MRADEAERERLQDQFDATHTQLERNIRGQFATPYPLATTIMRDAAKRVPGASTMLEPSCGTGSFVSAAREVCPRVHVTGVESDPSVAAIAKALWDGPATDIREADFLDVTDGLGQFDLLVTNPPYTRHHHIGAERKARYSKAVERACGRRLSQLAGLHAYFVLVGTSLVRPGGVASWLVPSELFSVNYGRVIRDYVTSDVRVERLHLFGDESLQFDDALVSSCVLVVRRAPAKPDDPVEVTFGDMDSPSRSMTTTIAALRESARWQHVFDAPGDSAASTVGDFLYVKRGLSTGGESFWVRHLDEWESLGIGRRWLEPILPAPRNLEGLVVDADDDGWPVGMDMALLRPPAKATEDDLPEPVRSVLASCPDKIRHGYTATHRKTWFHVEDREPAPIVCTYMSRSGARPFRFVRNRSKAVAATAWLCMYPRTPMSSEELDDLADALNGITTETLVRSGREYGGGLRKLEPRELLAVPFDFGRDRP